MSFFFILASTEVPPEYQEVLKDPKVVELVTTLIIAIIGALIGLAAFGKKWADAKMAGLDDKMAGLDAKLKPIKKDVANVLYQTENNHGPEGKDINLREQLDAIQEENREGFRRMDNQFGEVHDRQIQIEKRMDSIDNRILIENDRVWKQIESKKE